MTLPPSISLPPSKHPFAEYIYRLEAGDNLLPDTPENVSEVVGILYSYGIVLKAYYQNLLFIADHQFLVLFPFFKYFNGEVTFQKLLRHWWHDRINYEYAEYAMRVMLWHGGGRLDSYLDTPEFIAAAHQAIQAKIKDNLFIQILNRLFPEFLLEQIRQQVYYSALGQFWAVMSPLFLNLATAYDQGKIHSIPEVVNFILQGLVEASQIPITYQVEINGKTYPLLPAAANLTFLMDVAVPYVETIFFRGTPFLGTISFNAQAQQIPNEQSNFGYGALFADPLPTGGAGIPPTLLMQDMRHYLPDYLHQFYQQSLRGESDLLVKICISFQKSMYCVTSAAIKGLAPYPLETSDLEQRRANRHYLENWMDRFLGSQLQNVNL